MKDCIYVLYNKLSGRYESVFSFPTDAVCINALQKGKFKRDVYDVCKVGDIGLTDGIITHYAPVRLDIPDVKDEPLPVAEANN